MSLHCNGKLQNSFKQEGGKLIDVFVLLQKSKKKRHHSVSYFNV